MKEVETTIHPRSSSRNSVVESVELSMTLLVMLMSEMEPSKL